MKTTSIITLVLFGFGCFGQLKPNQQFKDVNGAGPYPLYIRFAPPYLYNEFGNPDFHSGIQFYNEQKSTALKEKKVATGFDVTIGYKLKRRKGFFELNYSRASANASNNDVLLIVGDRMYSARFGFAKTIYYPISFQVFGGFVIGENFITEDNGTTSTTFRFQGKDWWNDKKGAEAGIRLVVFDPAASSGGLGVSLEARAVNFFDRYSFEPYVKYLNPNSTFNYVSTTKMFWCFSLNMVVPIGLKF